MRTLLVCVIALSACGSDEDGVTIDAGKGGDGAPGPGVICLDTPCDLGQECCARIAGPSGGTCQDPGLDCTGYSFVCDGPEDCPQLGGVCCSRSMNAACEGGGPIAPCQGGELVCHDEQDCPPGNLCCPLTFFGGGDSGVSLCVDGVACPIP